MHFLEFAPEFFSERICLCFHTNLCLVGVWRGGRGRLVRVWNQCLLSFLITINKLGVLFVRQSTLMDVLPMLSEVLKLKDTSMLSLEVTVSSLSWFSLNTSWLREMPESWKKIPWVVSVINWDLFLKGWRFYLSRNVSISLITLHPLYTRSQRFLWPWPIFWRSPNLFL